MCTKVFALWWIYAMVDHSRDYSPFLHWVTDFTKLISSPMTFLLLLVLLCPSSSSPNFCTNPSILDLTNPSVITLHFLLLPTTFLLVGVDCSYSVFFSFIPSSIWVAINVLLELCGNIMRGFITSFQHVSEDFVAIL